MTISLDDVFNAPRRDHEYNDFKGASKYEDLMDCLRREHPDATRVWDYYVELLEFLGFKPLPLEIHQRVLRKCVPPTVELRALAFRRLQEGNPPKGSHMYENRVRAVINNIRASGWNPELEDYHFILAQFAAVGHHLGSRHVVKEVLSVGLQPTAKTYGLCLQAFAHRLTLPSPEGQRERLVENVTRMCMEILDEMHVHKIPYKSVNFDLAIRILKDAEDLRGFQKLLKIGYGVDLDNPDCPIDGSTNPAAAGGDSLTPPLAPLPFSTAALNTTLYILGREGRMSKMMQTFEVLTSPLPSAPPPRLSDEDDEDDYGLIPPPVFPSSYRFPYTEPNTTSYNTMIQAAARAGHMVICRHYVLQAMRHDREVDRRLRGDLMTKPMDAILAPRIAVNRGTLLPVFGEANRNKNIEMLRFIHRACSRVLRRKRVHVVLYSQYADNSRLVASDSSTTTAMKSQTSFESESGASPTASQFRDGRGLDHVVNPLEGHNKQGDNPRVGRTRVAAATSPLDIDLDAPSSSPPPKFFDVHLHVSLLQRDIVEIDELVGRIEDALGRTIQRVKERLGRRVWATKDVYVATEDKRVNVSRGVWKDIVRFRSSMAKGTHVDRRQLGESRTHRHSRS